MTDQLSPIALYDIDALRAERIRLRALQSLRSPRSTETFSRKYLEPLAVSGVSLLILIWTFERAASVLIR